VQVHPLSHWLRLWECRRVSVKRKLFSAINTFHWRRDVDVTQAGPLAGTLHYALNVITNIGSTQPSDAEGRHKFLVNVCILLRDICGSAKVLALTRKQELKIMSPFV